eukprot:gene24389-biopygen14648
MAMVSARRRALAKWAGAAAFALVPAVAAQAAPLGSLDRNGSHVSIEPYAPNIVRVTIAVDRDLADVFKRFPRLDERRRQAAGTLSGGERQMLALGRALMMRPRLLMLDEPSLGLAPLIVREIFRAITALRETGVSILLVEQNARAALETADVGYILETGEVAGHGPAQELMHDPRLIATYLGSH